MIGKCKQILAWVIGIPIVIILVAGFITLILLDMIEDFAHTHSEWYRHMKLRIFWRRSFFKRS